MCKRQPVYKIRSLVDSSVLFFRLRNSWAGVMRTFAMVFWVRPFQATDDSAYIEYRLALTTSRTSAKFQATDGFFQKFAQTNLALWGFYRVVSILSTIEGQRRGVRNQSIFLLRYSIGRWGQTDASKLAKWYGRLRFNWPRAQRLEVLSKHSTYAGWHPIGATSPRGRSSLVSWSTIWSTKF